MPRHFLMFGHLFVTLKCEVYFLYFLSVVVVFSANDQESRIIEVHHSGRVRRH